MAAPRIAPDSTEDILCCPRCHGPLPMETALACGRCGAPCRWEGPVLNFLGEKAFQLPAANDISVAAWLVEDRSHLAAVIDGVKSPHGPAKEYPTEKLSANSSFTAADVAHMVASVPFLQIANDLKRILERS